MRIDNMTISKKGSNKHASSKKGTKTIKNPRVEKLRRISKGKNKPTKQEIDMISDEWEGAREYMEASIKTKDPKKKQMFRQMAMDGALDNGTEIDDPRSKDVSNL